MDVAETAVATAEQDQALALAHQVCDQRFLVLVENLGPHRHLDHHVIAPGAGALAA